MTNRTDIKQYHGGKLIVIGIVLVATFIVIATGVAALAAMLLMWAWGHFMVPIFDMPFLDFAEAFGAIIILIIIRFMLGTGRIKLVK